MSESTASLYNRSAADWQRQEPVLLSDFTARPFLLDWCEPARGLTVLDLGCGEGYFARKLVARGAGRLVAVDISEEMIRCATTREASERLGIEFRTGDATDLSLFADAAFDLVVAVFMFNYLDREQTQRTLAGIHRVLRPGGRVVFAVPHPSLAFLRKEEPPFYFSRGEAGYFSARDRLFEGRIWRRDGQSVPVRCVHKTLEDYFTGLRQAGFTRMPELKELHVTDEHLAFDPGWFSALRDEPLHLAFRVEKEGALRVEKEVTP